MIKRILIANKSPSLNACKQFVFAVPRSKPNLWDKVSPYSTTRGPAFIPEFNCSPNSREVHVLHQNLSVWFGGRRGGAGGGSWLVRGESLALSAPSHRGRASPPQHRLTPGPPKGRPGAKEECSVRVRSSLPAVPRTVTARSPSPRRRTCPPCLAVPGPQRILPPGRTRSCGVSTARFDPVRGGNARRAQQRPAQPLSFPSPASGVCVCVCVIWEYLWSKGGEPVAGRADVARKTLCTAPRRTPAPGAACSGLSETLTR